jgi:hypothetical protein
MAFLTKVNYTNNNKNVSEKFIKINENNSLSLSILLDKYNTEYSIISFNNVFGEYIFFDKNDYIIKVNEPKFNIEEEIFLIEKNSNSKEISFTINFNNSNDLELLKMQFILEKINVIKLIIIFLNAILQKIIQIMLL